LIAYRIARKKFAQKLDGNGGLKASGRCHYKGTRVIYAAQHVSLALTEILVHLELPEVPLDYMLVTIDIPDRVPMRQGTPEEVLDVSRNPDVPVYLVPSVIVPQELNVVMFPAARGFEAKIVKIEPFIIDGRLLGFAEDR
jgi:RES domain-containing protein